VFNVLVADTNLCAFRSTDYSVQQFPIQVPLISGKHFYCESDSVLLLATAGFSQLQWSSGATSNAIYVQAGNFSLTANDSNNCKSYSTAFMVAPSLPQVQISGAKNLCGEDSAALGLNASFATYQWSNSTTQATTYAHAGTTWVQVSDSIGCPASDTLILYAYALPDAYFTYEPTTIEAGQNVQFLNASQSSNGSITNYYWTYDLATVISAQANASFTFQDTGVFLINLRVTSEYGCVDDYRKIIEVNQNVLIPNIITPNGDGENDSFKILGLNTKANNRLFIFDRWGKLIYSSNAYNNDWKAEQLKDGVYYYTLKLDGEREFKGSLTLVR
jgi:gliding motility-associated-like protein